MWIDIHAHLYDLTDAPLLKVLDDARLEDVACVLNCAAYLRSSSTVIYQCSLSESLFGSVGISPFDVYDQPEDWETQLRSLCVKPRIIAVGEIWIDSTNPRYPPLERQLPFFEAQLRIARELGLPAIIHSRGAESEAVRICRSTGVTKALFHCFTGERNDLVQILDAGYYVSFSGIITFKNAAVSALVREVPLDRMFIETDTPYLSPVPFRGKRNSPSLVRYVGEEVCRLTGCDRETVQNAIKENMRKLFPLEP
jgi:TatD DNase family protein